MMRGFATFYGKHRIIASETSNIILSIAKNIISPQAMHHLTGKKFYDIINSMINKNLTRYLYEYNAERKRN